MRLHSNRNQNIGVKLKRIFALKLNFFDFTYNKPGFSQGLDFFHEPSGCDFFEHKPLIGYLNNGKVMIAQEKGSIINISSVTMCRWI